MERHELARLMRFEKEIPLWEGGPMVQVKGVPILDRDAWTVSAHLRCFSALVLDGGTLIESEGPQAVIDHSVDHVMKVLRTKLTPPRS